MATTINWPATLPQYAFAQRYSERQGVLLARTPMDAGPAKVRRVGAKPEVLGVSFEMTSAQVSTLETFVKTTLKGVARFNFTHPRTSTSREVRIVPSGEGDMYTVAYLASGRWRVDLDLEVLP